MKVIFNPLSNQFEMVTDTKEIRAVVMDVLRDVPLGGGGGGLQDAPSNGSLYGRQDGVWTIVPEGVTDHALLSNLDYASAAHTGFQETLTFPLAANLGGTGVANLAGSTLTLDAATSITGGGTLALGGFTLTVPATGTAALLATANVFTTQQMVDGASDQIQLRVQGHSTQTSNLQTWERSTGVAIGNVSIVAGAGVLGFNQIQAFTSTLKLFNANGTGLTIATDGELQIGGTDPDITVRPTVATNITYGFYDESPALVAQMIVTCSSGSASNGAYYFDSNYGVFFRNATNGTTYVSFVSATSYVGIGIATPATKLHIVNTTTITNAVLEVERLQAQVSTASAGGAAGFGVGLPFWAETATDGTNQQQGLISTSWVDATNATRKAKMSLRAYDTAARIGIEIEADGSVAKLGFYGVATVVRPTALTTQLTTITHTAPTPDYAIQDFVDVSLGAGWAFASHDEANTTLSVIANLQTRVDELETKLQALGLLT
jgi:hypothetical protein